MRGPRVVQVIESEVVRDGVTVRQWHTLAGEFLAESPTGTVTPKPSAPTVEAHVEPPAFAGEEQSMEELVAEMTSKIEKAGSKA